MAKIMLLCGRIASGKSRLADALRVQESAVVLSCDELMLTLRAAGDFDALAGRAKDYLCTLAQRLVRMDVSVILDFGFWSRAERRAVSERLAGLPVEWHYVDVSPADWRRNIADRNRAAAEGRTDAYPVDEGLLAKMEASFEPPDPDEIHVWHRNRRADRAPVKETP